MFQKKANSIRKFAKDNSFKEKGHRLQGKRYVYRKLIWNFWYR